LEESAENGKFFDEQRTGCAQGLHRKCRKSVDAIAGSRTKPFNTEDTGEHRVDKFFSNEFEEHPGDDVETAVA
jgi:hypothetical protein